MNLILCTFAISFSVCYLMSIISGFRLIGSHLEQHPSFPAHVLTRSVYAIRLGMLQQAAGYDTSASVKLTPHVNSNLVLSEWETSNIKLLLRE